MWGWVCVYFQTRQLDSNGWQLSRYWPGVVELLAAQRVCVLVKAGMCFQLKSYMSGNPQCCTMALRSPCMSTREGRSQPLQGLGECRAVLRGFCSLAWGSAMQASACWVSFLLCSVGCCPSVAWLPWWIAYLSLGPGYSLQQDMVGRYSLGGKGKDLL